MMDKKKEGLILYNETCTLCYQHIGIKKYICLICLNTLLCSKCEPEHIHPVLKCNGLHLSTVPEIYKYFKFHQMKNVKKPSIFFSNIFKREQQFEFKLSTLSNVFSMEKNEQRSIGIKIENTMNVPFDQSLDLMIIARNTKDLKIEEMKINNSVDPREVLEYKVNLESRPHNREYDVIFELYSAKVVVNANVLTVKIKVIDGLEDKPLNDFFAKYPNILVLERKQKEIIKQLMDNKVTTEHPYIIMAVCKNIKWNYEEAVKEFDNMKRKSIAKVKTFG